MVTAVVSNLFPVAFAIAWVSFLARRFVYKDNIVYAVAIAGAVSVLLYLLFGPIAALLDLLIWFIVVFGAYYVLQRR